jgi:hypothetical protein
MQFWVAWIVHFACSFVPINHHFFNSIEFLLSPILNLKITEVNLSFDNVFFLTNRSNKTVIFTKKYHYKKTI